MKQLPTDFSSFTETGGVEGMYKAQKKLTDLYEVLYADLVSLASVAGVTENDLQKYFVPEGNAESNNILFRLCSSLQNSGMMRNSIKFNDKKEPKYRTAIETVMFGYNTEKAADKYSNWTKIYDAMICAGVSDNGIREKKETNWEKYCRGLYNGLQFLTTKKDNKTGEETIRKLVLTTELTDTEIETINDISKGIHGLGFALTCDWLKECGCVWLAKPDVHIKSVIEHQKGISKIKDEDVLLEMFSWAEVVKNSGADPSATAYKLDRIIWLLCTGEFYLDGKRTGREAIYSKMDTI